MRKLILAFALLSLSLFLNGCGSSKMFVGEGDIKAEDRHSVNTIAMMPGGGLLSDAIAVELFNRGYQVYDTAQTTNLIARQNLINEFEIAKPQNLHLLKEAGIDAYLSVKATIDYDGTPRNVSVRLNSAVNGKLLAGLTWQNGWGCARGSGCDMSMHKDISETAAEIAKGLAITIEKNRQK